jgi:hypothetical protein
MVIMKKVVDVASDSDCWSALEQVLSGEQSLKSSIMITIDSIEMVGNMHSRSKFIEGIHLFIIRLQGKVKVLVTSHSEDDIKATSKGIPSIEFDKERQGSIIPHCLLWVNRNN